MKPEVQPYTRKRPPTATLTREQYEASQSDATSSPMLNSVQSFGDFHGGGYHKQTNLSENLSSDKKVLLRERKRHTARRVVSTPYVVLPGYPPRGGPGTPPRGGLGTPPGGTWSGTPPRGSGSPPGGVPGQVPPGGVQVPPGGDPVRYPPRGVRVPPGGYPVRYPPGGVRYPPGGVRVPPPRCLMAFWEMLQSIMGYGYPPPQVWTDKVKLLPSRRTTYAGGKNATQMGSGSSIDIPRFHPYQRRRSALPSHGQMQNFGQRISSHSSHGYNGYGSNMEQSHPQVNTNWHAGDQSYVRNDTALDHSVHRPVFQRIRLSSKFLK